MATRTAHGKKKVSRKPSITERITRVVIFALAAVIGIALIYALYLQLF